MGYDAIIATPALVDIERAIAYLAQELSTPRAASSLADELERKLGYLADNPHLYGVHPVVSSLIGRDVRSCPVKGYLLWFLLDDDTATVSVVAFLHGLQNTQTHLSERV